MALSPEQSKLFEDFNFMFGTDGWKLLIEDIKLKQDDIPDTLLSNKMTTEDLSFIKGRNDVYTYLLGLQSLMEQFRKQGDEVVDDFV